MRTKYYIKQMIIVSVLVAILLISPAYAATILQDGEAPGSEGAYTPVDTDAGYVEATNSFDDGNPSYYLITQDLTKDGLGSINYGGKDYALSEVLVGKDLETLKITGDTYSIFDYHSPGNRTFFIDDGIYNDGTYTNYTGLSKENLSLVGLNKAEGEPAVTITRSPYPSDYSTSAIRNMIERYNILNSNVYFENIIFDGENHELLPLGGKTFWGGNTGIGKNRGEYMFFFTTGSQGFVMRDCIIQNVGSDNSTQPGSLMSPYLVRKNVALNFYRSTGQHNVEDVIIRNVKTKRGYGIVSFNQTKDNYLKNITINGDNSHEQSRSIKVEVFNSDTSVLSINENSVTFAGKIDLPADKAHDHIYVQDYRYDFVKVPLDFKYAKWKVTNGNDILESLDIHKSYPGVSEGIYQGTTYSTNWAVQDLKDDYWIVEADNTKLTIKEQLEDIKKVMDYAGAKAPSANIKLVAAGDIPSFAVPDFGNIPVNIVAVNQVEDPNTTTDLVPFVAEGTIDLPANNQVKFYNFDFHEKAKYTVHQASTGITPLTAEKLQDPNEMSSPEGYPVYSTYGPTEAQKAKVTNSTEASYVNCKFTVLDHELQGSTNQNVAVGKTINLDVSVKDGYTISPATATPPSQGLTLKPAADVDDPAIVYYSSDTNIATVNETGVVTGVGSGTAIIYAKATDLNNQGEIEKPFLKIEVQVKANTPPTITATDKRININTTFNPLTDVTASDEEDGDLTSSVIVVENDVNTTMAGTYHVTYKVTDSGGLVTEKIITVIVNGPPTITADDISLKIGDSFDPLKDVTAADVEDGDLTSHVTVVESNVDTSVEGIYNVTYKVIDSDGLTTEKTITVKVNPPLTPLNMVPTIAATNKTLWVGDNFDPLAEVTASDNEDGDITNKIVIISNNVDTSKVGVYEVVYKVTDSNDASCTKTINVTVKQNTPPVINASDSIIWAENTFDPLAIMNAKDAEDGDLTDKVSILSNDVDTSKPGIYHVTYSVTDSQGETTTKTIRVIVLPKGTQPPTPPTPPTPPAPPTPLTPTDSDQITSVAVKIIHSLIPFTGDTQGAPLIAIGVALVALAGGGAFFYFKNKRG